MSARRDAMARSLFALKNRGFRTFIMGEVVSTIGTWMQMLAQSWLVLELTDSGAALGVTVALQALPLLLVGAWAGVIADRVDCRRILQITAVAGALQAVGLGAMAATGHATVAWIYVFALILGVVSAFERPALHAMIFELAEPDELSSAIGIGSTLNSSGRLIGPAIGGLLIASVGIAPVFFLNAATFAAVLVALAFIPNSARRARTVRRAGAVKLRDGLSYVWHEPNLRLAMIVMGVVGLFAYNLAVIVPTMVRFEFDASAGSFGFVQMVGGIGSIAGGLVAGSFYRPSIRVLGLVATAFGTAIIVTAFSPTLVAFALLTLPLGVGSAMFTTVDQTVLQQGADPAYQGRVMSLFTIAWQGTTPIGGLIAGAIIDTWSPRAALGVGAVAALGSAALVFAVDHRRRAHAGDVAADAATGPRAAELDSDLATGT